MTLRQRVVRFVPVTVRRAVRQQLAARRSPGKPQPVATAPQAEPAAERPSPPPPPPPVQPSPAQRAVAELEQRQESFRPSVRHNGHILHRGKNTYWAQRSDVGHWRELAAANAAMVCDAFAAHGVDYFVLEAEINRRRILVVDAARRDDAWRALVGELAPEAAYVVEVAGARRMPFRLLGAEIESCPGDAWRVFRVHTTLDGTYLTSNEAACEVQFWTETTAETPPARNHELFEPGSLVAPAALNIWTHVVPASDRGLVDRLVDGRLVPTLAALTDPPVFRTTVPIDVVYTWVDGADPVWQQERAAAHARLPAEALHPLADNTARYVSHDELRYSLRSLEFYADWVGHVYLVTAGQVPDWLDESNPRLTVVHHRDIFTDPAVLPTFNSHAIESQLHHIDGLHEHFLYLNDDVFFTAPVTPEHFVLSSGLTRFFLSNAKIGLGPVRSGDTPVVQAGKRNAALLQRDYGVRITQRLQHVPHALRRSVLADIEATFPEEHAATAASRFRSAADLSITSSLAHYYGYLTGRAVAGTLRYRYADIAEDTTPAALEDLLANRNKDVVCLNETATAPEQATDQAALVTSFLDAYFPRPSTFERSGARLS